MRDLFDQQLKLRGWFDESLTPPGWFDESFVGQQFLTLSATEAQDTASFDVETIAAANVAAQEAEDTVSFTLASVTTLTLSAQEAEDTAAFTVHAPQAPTVPVTRFGGGRGTTFERHPKRTIRAWMFAKEAPDTAAFVLHAQPKRTPAPPLVPALPLPIPPFAAYPITTIATLVPSIAAVMLAMEEEDVASFAVESVNIIEADNEFMLL